MCSKRSLRVLADTDDQQENKPRNSPKSLSQHRSKAFGDSPKGCGSNILVESLSTQARNPISKFEESWLALNKSGMGQTMMDSSEDSSSLTCSPATKRRTPALPICVIQNSPRTPPGISRPRLSNSFQTSRRWNELMSEEFCQALKRKSPLTSPSMPARSPRLLASSFKTSRRWSELVNEKSSQTFNNNSSRTSPLTDQANRSPRTLSSSFRTFQRWNDLMSDDLLIESICTDLSDDSESESSPVIRLVPDQPSQYLPSSSQKKVTPKPAIRAVKGGYAHRFQQLLKTMRMDQRHLSGREATHKVRVLAMTEELNVTMALVEVESKTGSPSSSFNILLQSKQSKNVKIGCKLQFHLDVNSKPLLLSNKQLVYCQPHNVIVLER